MLGPRITQPEAQAASLQRWPAGRIIMHRGRLVEIRCGVLPRRVSVAQVWWDTKWRRRGEDRCTLDYHSPLFGRYLTLDYIAAGRSARLATVLGACRVLDEIARIRGAVAIFAHISTTAISDALLIRYGWQRHMPSAPGRHWVKRFYDGYPSMDVQRYLGGGTAPRQNGELIAACSASVPQQAFGPASFAPASSPFVT